MNTQITQKALISRINRKLDKEQQQLHTSRTEDTNLGWYYIRDTHTSSLVAAHVDPVELGKELRVLESWETLA